MNKKQLESVNLDRSIQLQEIETALKEATNILNTSEEEYLNAVHMRECIPSRYVKELESNRLNIKASKIIRNIHARKYLPLYMEKQTLSFLEETSCTKESEEKLRALINDAKLSMQIDTYVCDVSSEEELNQFFKNNSKLISIKEYPEQYPCKVVVNVIDSSKVKYTFAYEKSDFKAGTIFLCNFGDAFK